MDIDYVFCSPPSFAAATHTLRIYLILQRERASSPTGENLQKTGRSRGRRRRVASGIRAVRPNRSCFITFTSSRFVILSAFTLIVAAYSAPATRAALAQRFHVIHTIPWLLPQLHAGVDAVSALRRHHPRLSQGRGKHGLAPASGGRGPRGGRVVCHSHNVPTVRQKDGWGLSPSVFWPLPLPLSSPPPPDRPRLGCPGFTEPPYLPSPGDDISKSLFWPDEAINQHPRSVAKKGEQQ